MIAGSAPLQSIYALVLREVSATQGKTGLGYFWTLLEPIFGIGLLCLAMSVFLDLPPLGNSFALFYATGFLPFFMVLEIAQKMGAALKAARPLLIYPRVSYLDAIAARFLLGVMTHAGIWAAMLIALGARQADIASLAAGFFMCAALAFGMGVFHAFMTTVWASWPLVWSILSRPLFLVSGIFFLVEELGDPFQSIVLFNPVAHLVVALRQAIFPGYMSEISQLFVSFVALLCGVIGLVGLALTHRRVLEEGQ